MTKKEALKAMDYKIKDGKRQHHAHVGKQKTDGNAPADLPAVAGKVRRDVGGLL